MKNIIAPLLILAFLFLSTDLAQAAAECPTGSELRAGLCVPTAQDTGLSDDDASSVLVNVIKFALGFLAALSILVIIFAGITYITSGGNEDRIETAKKILIYAVIGLIVALLGYVIVAAVSGVLL